MITITPAAAQQHIDRAFVMDSLARVHTAWGEATWNAGDNPAAIRHWRVAARYSITTKQEGACTP